MSTHQEQAADELLLKLEQLLGVGAFQGALIPMTDLIRAALDAAARTALEEAADALDLWDDESAYSSMYFADWLRARAESLSETPK